jgi:hypothetical protein
MTKSTAKLHRKRRLCRRRAIGSPCPDTCIAPATAGSSFINHTDHGRRPPPDFPRRADAATNAATGALATALSSVRLARHQRQFIARRRSAGTRPGTSGGRLSPGAVAGRPCRRHQPHASPRRLLHPPIARRARLLQLMDIFAPACGATCRSSSQRQGGLSRHRDLHPRSSMAGSS